MVTAIVLTVGIILSGISLFLFLDKIEDVGTLKLGETEIPLIPIVLLIAIGFSGFKLLKKFK